MRALHRLGLPVLLATCAASAAETAAIDVRQPRDHLPVVGGEPFAIEVEADNLGDATWDPADGQRLAVTVDGVALPEQKIAAAVPPQRFHPFALRAVAPARAGDCAVAFALLDRAGATLAKASRTIAVGAAPETVTNDAAAVISIKTPDRLRADEVFLAEITVENRGPVTWGGGNVELRTPDGSATWGADKIIQLQGAQTKPGERYVFSCNLRAPPAAGAWPFQWQLRRDGKPEGAPTALRTIEVAPGDLPTDLMQPIPADLATVRDFEYVGSFRLPLEVAGKESTFTGGGIALRRMPDGSERVIANAGVNADEVLYEATIPVPAPWTGDPDKLPQAKLERVWGDIYGKVKRVPGEPNDDQARVGDLEWDEATKTIYWSAWHEYRAGPPIPILGATELRDDGTAQPAGQWLPPAKLTQYKGYWSGIARLPDAIAQKLGGRPYMLGFGGGFSINPPCSDGPTVGAIKRPDPASPALDVQTLLEYPFGSAQAPRRGDYLLCNMYGEPPQDRFHGHWNPADDSRTAVWIDTGDQRCLLAFARQKTGRIGYDYGSVTFAGQADNWYFYDPDDLLAVATGARKPTEPKPYLIQPAPLPFGSFVTGSHFDPQERLLYVNVAWGYQMGPATHPAVHVYRLRPGRRGPAPAKP